MTREEYRCQAERRCFAEKRCPQRDATSQVIKVCKTNRQTANRFGSGRLLVNLFIALVQVGFLGRRWRGMVKGRIEDRKQTVYKIDC